MAVINGFFTPEDYFKMVKKSTKKTIDDVRYQPSVCVGRCACKNREVGWKSPDIIKK